VGSQGHGELLWTWYVHRTTLHHIHRATLTNLQVDVKIPTDIAPGDYLLRAEVIALHVAGGLNGAQFYPSCYQITVAGSGSASPAGVSFPGAYKNTDPGILVDIHAKLSTYIDPGPTVYAGGVSKTPGNTKCTGQAASEGPGGKPATGVNYTYNAHQSLTKADKI
jgi:cellulase